MNTQTTVPNKIEWINTLTFTALKELINNGFFHRTTPGNATHTTQAQIRVTQKTITTIN